MEQMEILTELTKIIGKIEGLAEKHELMTKQIADANAHTQKKIEQLNHLLTGNGDPTSGVMIRLTLLEKASDEHEQKFKTFEDWRRWSSRIIIGGLLTAIVGGIVYAVKTSLFHHP